MNFEVTIGILHHWEPPALVGLNRGSPACLNCQFARTAYILNSLTVEIFIQYTPFSSFCDLPGDLNVKRPDCTKPISVPIFTSNIDRNISPHIVADIALVGHISPYRKKITSPR